MNRDQRKRELEAHLQALDVIYPGRGSPRRRAENNDKRRAAKQEVIAEAAKLKLKSGTDVAVPASNAPFDEYDDIGAGFGTNYRDPFTGRGRKRFGVRRSRVRFSQRAG